MRQAIETKYLGPTNYRGARVKASAQAGNVTLSWDHALDVNDNHLAAATALANKYGWLDGYTLIGGGSADGKGNVYVSIPYGEAVVRNLMHPCGCKKTDH